jgi:hypothetical protein
VYNNRGNGEEIMPDLTDKEYDALDEYYTKNTVMPIGKPGFFAARKAACTVSVDDVSVEMVRKKIMAQTSVA